jgi:hypothetical protein
MTATSVDALPKEALGNLLSAAGSGVVHKADEIHASLRALIGAIGAVAEAPDPGASGAPECARPLPPLPQECTIFPPRQFRTWMDAQRRDAGTSPLSEAAASRLQVKLQSDAIHVIRAAQVLAEDRIKRPRMQSQRVRKGATAALLPRDIEGIVAGLDAVGNRAATAARRADLEAYIRRPKKRRRRRAEPEGEEDTEGAD